MRKIILPLLVLTLASCAWRRDAAFVRQRLFGFARPATASTTARPPSAAGRLEASLKTLTPSLFFLHYATGDERSAARVGVLQAFYRSYKDAGRRRRASFRSLTAITGFFHPARSAPDRRPRRLRSPPAAPRENPPKRRYLWGMSMGGYNAAEEALASPRGLDRGRPGLSALQTLNPFDGR